MNVEQIMFSLIRSEVSGRELANDVKPSLAPDVYENLLVLSEKHDLSHIVASALSKNGLFNANPISNRFRDKLMMAVYRDEQKGYVLEEICNTLELSKIPYMPLKGAVVRNYYPQTWMRTSCDIDILIHHEDSEKAINKLCEAGFIRCEDRSTHDYNLMSPNGVHLELHYTLTQDGKISKSDNILESVWETAILDDGYNYRYNMEEEMLLLYHLAHMGRHFLHGGCGVRPFIDLWLLKNKMTYSAENFQKILEEAKLLDFYKATSYLCDVWFEGETHSELSKCMEKILLTGGVYGNIVNSAKMNAAKGDGKLKFLIKLMFLPRANLEVMYPNLKKHPVLFPLYQIKRWFRFFQKNKRGKMKQLIKARNSVSQDETGEIKSLLKDIGLC